MGTVTLVLDDEVEKKFREIVRVEHGTGKGSIKTAVNEALSIWISKKEKCASSIALRLLEEGIDMGKPLYSRRDELHR